MLTVGLIGLWRGTDLAIHGAVSIARNLRLSEFVVGIAVLSIGSDLPELTIAIDAGIRNLEGADMSDVVVGSAVGSSLGQIGLVLGIAGLLGYLTLPMYILKQHGGVMLGALVILVLTGLDGTVTRTEGVSLLTIYAIYFVLLLTDRRSYEKPKDGEKTAALPTAWACALGGVAIVIVGAELTVRSVTNVAEALAIDAAIIAIVIIGIGTSLPELSISVGAMLKKRAQMSVGNLIGSNIFDTLVPIGAAAVIARLSFDELILRFDLPFLFALTVIVMFFFAHKKGLQKGEAITVLGLYIAYVLVRLAHA